MLKVKNCGKNGEKGKKGFIKNVFQYSGYPCTIKEILNLIIFKVLLMAS